VRLSLHNAGKGVLVVPLSSSLIFTSKNFSQGGMQCCQVSRKFCESHGFDTDLEVSRKASDFQGKSNKLSSFKIVGSAVAWHLLRYCQVVARESKN